MKLKRLIAGLVAFVVRRLGHLDRRPLAIGTDDWRSQPLRRPDVFVGDGPALRSCVGDGEDHSDADGQEPGDHVCAPLKTFRLKAEATRLRAARNGAASSRS
jgi:hypothetical protein